MYASMQRLFLLMAENWTTMLPNTCGFASSVLLSSCVL